MSTNASIAKVYADGSVKEITVHWDGYISGAGIILSEYYQDPEKVDALLALGNISGLGRYVEVAPCLKKYGSNAFDKSREVSKESDENNYEIHSSTLAYHRDRGEELKYYEYDNIDEYYKSIADDACIEFAYINIDNVWYVSIHDYEKGKSRIKLLSDLVLDYMN